MTPSIGNTDQTCKHPGMLGEVGCRRKMKPSLHTTQAPTQICKTRFPGLPLLTCVPTAIVRGPLGRLGADAGRPPHPQTLPRAHSKSHARLKVEPPLSQMPLLDMLVLPFLCPFIVERSSFSMVHRRFALVLPLSSSSRVLLFSSSPRRLVSLPPRLSSSSSAATVATASPPPPPKSPSSPSAMASEPAMSPLPRSPSATATAPAPPRSPWFLSSPSSPMAACVSVCSCHGFGCNCGCCCPPWDNRCCIPCCCSCCSCSCCCCPCHGAVSPRPAHRMPMVCMGLAKAQRPAKRFRPKSPAIGLGPRQTQPRNSRSSTTLVRGSCILCCCRPPRRTSLPATRLPRDRSVQIHISDPAALPLCAPCAAHIPLDVHGAALCSAIAAGPSTPGWTCAETPGRAHALRLALGVVFRTRCWEGPCLEL